MGLAAFYLMFLSGFEPLAFRLGGGRSILLSYRNLLIFGTISTLSYSLKKIKSPSDKLIVP